MRAGPIRVRWAVLLLVLASCATVSEQEGEGACTSDLPRDPRPLDSIVDSTAIAELLRPLFAGSTDLTLALVSRDSIGRAVASPIGWAHLHPVSRLIVQSAFTRFARPAESAEPVFVVVADQTGLALRRVPGFRTCPPRLLNRDMIWSMAAQEAAGLGLTRSATVEVLVMVGTDGRPDDISLRRPSADPLVNDAALRVMRSAVFSVQRIEGFPFRIGVALPLSLVPPRPTGG